MDSRSILFVLCLLAATIAPAEEAYRWVDEDGVVLRISHTEYLLTTANPNLAYLRARIGRWQVEIDDVT